MMHLGDYKEDSLVFFCWGTVAQGGASITRATDGNIGIIKDDLTSHVANITDTEDLSGMTGIHACAIDTSGHAFFATGHDYAVVLIGASIDGQTVNAPIAHFSIENRSVDNSPLEKKALKSLVNKAIQNKTTGAIQYFDDDGETVILTHTPTDGASSITRTPS